MEGEGLSAGARMDTETRSTLGVVGAIELGEQIAASLPRNSTKVFRIAFCREVWDLGAGRPGLDQYRSSPQRPQLCRRELD